MNEYRYKAYKKLSWERDDYKPTKLKRWSLLRKIVTSLLTSFFVLALGISCPLWPITVLFSIAIAVFSMLSIFYPIADGECPKCNNKLTITKRNEVVTCKKCKSVSKRQGEFLIPVF